jgi:hypothetical protein
MEPRPIAGGINRDDWLRALRDAEGPPPEYDASAITVAEFAVQFQCGRECARKRLHALVATGHVQEVMKQWKDRTGRTTYAKAYRLVKK